MADLIKLTRDAKAFPESYEATVDAADLAEWQANGWAVADPLDHDADGKKGGSEPDEGLTKAELTADLEAMGIDFNPRASKAELQALRDEARAIRDA